MTVRFTETGLAAVAVIAALTVDAGLDVVMAKVAESWPAGIKTLGGQLTAALLLESVTVAPLAPAGAASNNVPVVEAPPVNVVAAAVTCKASGACKLRVAFTVPQGAALTALTDAPIRLISAFTVRLTGAEVCPAATVTVPRVMALTISCTG